MTIATERAYFGEAGYAVFTSEDGLTDFIVHREIFEANGIPFRSDRHMPKEVIAGTPLGGLDKHTGKSKFIASEIHEP